MTFMDTELYTPVLFLIFNRPDTTEQVFNEIKRAKPKYLYVASDWPRENKDWEAEIVEKTRKLVIDNIDWDCEVKTLFREKNLWCKYAVSWAITWFFENVEQWIILEDDCLPAQSFFWFCQELLEKYKDDMRISSISWSMPYNDWIKINSDYFISKYSRIWWWATWKWFWNLYDVEIKTRPFIKSSKIHKNYLQYKLEIRNREEKWDKCYNGQIDTWDYQLYLYKVLSCSYTIVSTKNLVSNIWFNENATHTKDKNNKFSNTNKHELNNIKHINIFHVEYWKDMWYMNHFYWKKNNKIFNLIKTIIWKK